MTDVQEILYRSGQLVAIGCMLAVVVPYLLGRRDLFLPSNFYLGGTGLFIGISAMRAADQPQYTIYPDAVYYKLFIGFVVLWIAMGVSYFYNPLSSKIAGRALRKWPAVTTTSMLVMAWVALFFAALSIVPIPVPVLGQLLFRVGIQMGPFAVIFALTAWHRDKSNPVCLLNMLGIIGAAVVLSMAFGGGRRILVGTLMAVPVYAYWGWLRYKSRYVSFASLVLGVLIAFAVLQGFDKVRRRSGTQEGGGRIGRAVQSAKMAAQEAKGAFRTNLYNTAQPGVEVSLLTIHIFTGADRVREGSPFHVVYTILAGPIPREFWPEGKPEGLASRVPQIAKTAYNLGGYNTPTWSINPVSQGYHDGGLVPIFVYGVLLGFGLRFFDEILVRQATNPYLIGMLAATSGHIVGMARGSVDVMCWMFIACILALFLLRFIGLLVFGYGLEYARTDGIQSFANIGQIYESLKQPSSQRNYS